MPQCGGSAAHLCLVLARPPADAAPAEIAFAGAEGIVAIRADGSDRHVLVAGKHDVAAGLVAGRVDARLRRRRPHHDRRRRRHARRRRAAATSPRAGPRTARTIAFSRFIEQSDEQLPLRRSSCASWRPAPNACSSTRSWTGASPPWPLPPGHPTGATIAYSRSRLNRTVLLRPGRPDDPRRGRHAARADPRRALGGLVARRRPDRVRGHPRPQRPALRLGRVQLGRRAVCRRRRRQRSQAADPQRGRGRTAGVVPGRVAAPLQQRPERARRRLLRGLLDRPRRQLLHVADQRDPGSAYPRGDRAAATPSTPAAAIRHARPAARRDVTEAVRGRPVARLRYRGLLLADADKNSLDYGDCERFAARECPPTIYLGSKSVCAGSRIAA